MVYMRIIPALVLSAIVACSSLAAPGTIHPPEEYDVIHYGADASGKQISTTAIQAAIDAAFENGGGKVTFQKGTYLSGSIVLKNNVNLYLGQDVVLLGSTDPAEYKKINSKMALVLADNATGISISGAGTINGQGRALALNVDSLHHIGEQVDPNYNYRRMRPNESRRPELINMYRCQKVNITGVTLKNASSWVQTYEQCDNMQIDRVTVDSRAYWNNDGFDIVDCTNVRLTRCDVNSADDGICLKSHSTDHMNSNIYIADCTVRSSASAVKFGTASFGGFKDITIENIRVFDTFRSAIAIESVDGGIIENVIVRNITALNTGNALFIRLGHRSGSEPGSVKNITIKDMYVQVPFGRPDIRYDMRGPEVDFFHNPFPAPIAGIPGHHIENVVLENIEIRYPGRASKGMAYVPLSRLEQVPEKIEDYPEFSVFGELPSWGFYARHVTNLEMKNITLTLDNYDFRPAFVFDDVKDLDMRKIKLPAGKKNQVYLNNVNAEVLDKYMSEQVIKP